MHIIFILFIEYPINNVINILYFSGLKQLL